MVTSGSYVVSRIAFQARKSFEKQPKAPESFFDNGNEKCVCIDLMKKDAWIILRNAYVVVQFLNWYKIV